eukprot:7017526-Pyramimonas_sp.AAC.1
MPPRRRSVQSLASARPAAPRGERRPKPDGLTTVTAPRQLLKPRRSLAAGHCQRSPWTTRASS